MAKPNKNGDVGNGVRAGQTLIDLVPAEFENGLHLGQWLRPDNGGLHLGQISHQPDPEPRELIINGDFGDPGVGVWNEDQVPGWYVPTLGTSQDITLSQANPLKSADDPFALIALTEINPLGPLGSRFGEIAQEVDAQPGETYTLRWDAWFDGSQLGPHVDGVQVIWNGETVTGTQIAQNPDTSGPYRWVTFETTVVGQEGTDTLTFHSALFTAGAGSKIDNVSLIGI